MGLGTAQKTISLIGKLPSDAPIKAMINSHYSKSTGQLSTISQGFERSTPESVGISSETVLSFLKDLHEDNSLRMHTIFIVKDNKCICDASFGPYSTRMPQYTFSACKSVTSIAIGCLVDEGKLKLSETVAEIFKEELTNTEKLATRKMTVRNLLMMQTGVMFAETSSMITENWLKGFAGSLMNSRPGEKFSYNSLNTYVLARIVTKKTGLSLSDYLKRKIFKYLGITNYYWEKCPMGYAKGGWGLYIAPEDFAKIGLLLAHKGVWNGKRLLSEEYINSATKKQVSAPSEYGDFDYGYQIWACRKNNSFLFNGMFGQNVIVFPDKDMVIVSTAGNNELFQQSTYFSHVWDHFDSEKEDRSTAKSYEKLSSFIEGLKTTKSERYDYYTSEKESEKITDFCEKLNGIKLVPNCSQKYVMGFMDICNQVIANQFSKGLSSISFSYENKKLYLTFTEPDKVYRIPVGFYDYEYADVFFANSVYKVAIIGKFAKDEDNRDVLKIKIDFLELPSTKIFKFKIENLGVVMVENEYPGELLITSYIKSFFQQNKKNPLLATLNLDNILYRAEQRAAPTINMAFETNN